MMNPADKQISNENFTNAAKMIEFNNIQPALMAGVLKQEVQRNRLKYAYPATIGNAKIHQNAYKFGYSSSRGGQSPSVCPCCLQRIDKEQIGICYRTGEVKVEEEMGYSEYKLLPGTALYFSFISMIVLYLLFHFIINDCFNLITNLSTTNYCRNENECYEIEWNLISIYNKKTNDKFILIQDILNLIIVILSIVFFFVYRMKQYSMGKLLYEKNQSQEDYSILVQDIPLIDFPNTNQAKKLRNKQNERMQLYHRQHLWKYFESKVKGWIDQKKSWKKGTGSNQGDFSNLISMNNGQLRSNQIVKTLSLCYNLERLQTLQREKDQLVRHHEKYQKIRKQLEEQQDDSGLGIMEVEGDNRFSSIPKQVQFLTDCQVILNKQYASDTSVFFNITNFVGKAIISFQYQHYRQYILEEADRNSNFLVFNGSRLKVSKICNPKDVLWKNFRHSRQKQNKKIISTVYAIAAIAAVIFGLLCAIQFARLKAQEAYANDNNSHFGKYGTYGFVFLAIAIILIGNEIILATSKHQSRRQCHYSKDHESLSIIVKAIIGQFICTAILPYLVSLIFGGKIASQTGLIFEMTTLIIFYALIINLLSIIFPKAVLRSLKLLKYSRKMPQQSINKFQVELNHQFQYIKFDMINRYVNYITLIFAASFYAYLIPVTIPILVVIFFIQFWIDKVNLFKRCSLPRNFSFGATRKVLKIFEASVFVFSLGTYILGINIHGGALNILNLIALGVATLYLWFLLGASIKLERKLFGSYESSHSAIYDDCVGEGVFQQTYWTQNPASYLAKESDITGKQLVLNPVLRKSFMTHSKAKSSQKSY